MTDARTKHQQKIQKAKSDLEDGKGNIKPDKIARVGCP